MQGMSRGQKTDKLGDMTEGVCSDQGKSWLSPWGVWRAIVRGSLLRLLLLSLIQMPIHYKKTLWFQKIYILSSQPWTQYTRKYTATINNGKSQESWGTPSGKSRIHQEPPPGQGPTLFSGHTVPQISKALFCIFAKTQPQPWVPKCCSLSVKLSLSLLSFTTFCANSLYSLSLISQLLNPV